jgi:hypothetical protein
VKFEWKAVRREIRLSEYAPEMEGGIVRVQVNVSREVMGRVVGVKSLSAEEFLALLRELWGPEEWPEEDLVALRDHCLENDPGLWNWLTRRTWELVLEYQGLVKKKLESS